MEVITKKQKLINDYATLDLKCLPEKLKKNGYQYELERRVPSKCIYAQWYTGKIIAYEVFETKIVPYRKKIAVLRKIIDPKEIEKLQEYAEMFPSDEEFGKRAWTYPALEKALKRYEELS